MKYSHDIIKQNLEVFEEAKKDISIFQQFINNEVSYSAISKVGLGKFADFHNLILNSKFQFIDLDVTWKKLKPILIANTSIPRFKKYLSNRTEKEFIELLTNSIKFDRYLNGKISRYDRRGRPCRVYDDEIDSLKKCSIPIFNYVVKNQIDCSINKIDNLNWFIDSQLSLGNFKKKEVDVTDSILKSISNVFDNSNVDFKKINIDYLQTSINDKLKSLMDIKIGNPLKCVINDSPQSPCTITEGKIYECKLTTIRNGFLYVYVKNDMDRYDYYPYANFEDIISFMDNTINKLLYNDRD